jgi:hypothetical protein
MQVKQNGIASTTMVGKRIVLACTVRWMADTRTIVAPSVPDR